MSYIYSKEVKELIPVTNHKEEVKVKIVFTDDSKHVLECCSIDDLDRHFDNMKVSNEVVEEYYKKVEE